MSLHYTRETEFAWGGGVHYHVVSVVATASAVQSSIQRF